MISGIWVLARHPNTLEQNKSHGCGGGRADSSASK